MLNIYELKKIYSIFFKSYFKFVYWQKMHFLVFHYLYTELFILKFCYLLFI